MEKKTAMEELIELITVVMEANEDDHDYYDGLAKAADFAQSLIPKEREQIEASINNCFKIFNESGFIPDASDYFTQNYGKG